MKERERKRKKEKRDSLNDHRNAEEKVIFKQKMKDKWQKNKRKRELIESKKKALREEENKYNGLKTLWHIYDLLDIDGKEVKSEILKNFSGAQENLDHTYVDERVEEEVLIESKYPNELKNLERKTIPIYYLNSKTLLDDIILDDHLTDLQKTILQSLNNYFNLKLNVYSDDEI